MLFAINLIKYIDNCKKTEKVAYYIEKNHNSRRPQFISFSGCGPAKSLFEEKLIWNSEKMEWKDQLDKACGKSLLTHC